MKMVALGEVAKVERQGVHPSTMPPSTPYLGLEHIERGGRILDHDTVGNANLSSTKFVFSDRHLLFGKLRPNLGKISRPDFGGVCSTDILPILPGRQTDRAYLAHFLSQPKMVQFAAAQASGANLPRLSPKVLESFAIPLPPLDEQRRIAAILDHADALRTKRRQVIEQLDELTQAIFIDMFGDPASCDTCERLPLDELLVDIDSGSSPVCEARPATGDEWAVLKLGAISYGEFNPAENKAFLGDVASMQQAEVQPGDFLFSRKNTKDLVGATVIVYDTPPRLLLPDLIFRLRLDTERLLPEYLHALLRSPRKRLQLVALASGSASSMVNISQARLRTLIIEVPPIERQREYASRLLSVRQRLRLCRVAVRKLDELFASLQSRAFSGQL